MDFHDFLTSIIRLSLWLMILVIIFVPLERLFSIHPQKVFRKGIVADLGYYLLNSLLPTMVLGAPAAVLAWIVHSTIPSGFLAMMGGMPLWARTIAGVVAGEFGYYWGHRWSHEIPFLWRFHAIHHSAEHVDFLVSSRAHPVDLVFGRFCGLVPIYVLGLGGPIGAAGTFVPVAASVFALMWGFFIHANLRWRFGPLEWLVSTPAFHHWHHTLKGPINHNYSSILPWVDRIFGTHHLPKEWPEAYGIEAKMPDSLVGQLVYPLLPEPPAVTVGPAVEEDKDAAEDASNVKAGAID
jgi:sterol desaturase/sphingolipid hydroxylase (fatty acid hydroxylase superfamily)